MLQKKARTLAVQDIDIRRVLMLTYKRNAPAVRARPPQFIHCMIRMVSGVTLPADAVVVLRRDSEAEATLPRSVT